MQEEKPRSVGTGGPEMLKRVISAVVSLVALLISMTAPISLVAMVSVLMAIGFSAYSIMQLLVELLDRWLDLKEKALAERSEEE